MLQKLEVDKHLATCITDIKFQTLIFLSSTFTWHKNVRHLRSNRTDSERT